MAPYKADFSVGSKIRVADRAFLENFMLSWKYHNKLQPNQLQFAGNEATVKSMGYYHGGDVLYWLEEAPGTWHEECLRKPAS